MKSRFFFVFDLGKLLRLVILILLIVVATCSCTDLPGSCPSAAKVFPSTHASRLYIAPPAALTQGPPVPLGLLTRGKQRV